MSEADAQDPLPQQFPGPQAAGGPQLPLPSGKPDPGLSPRGVPVHRAPSIIRWAVETLGPRLGLVVTAAFDVLMVFSMAFFNAWLNQLIVKYAPGSVDDWDIRTIIMLTQVATIVTAGGILIHDVWYTLKRLWGRDHAA